MCKNAENYLILMHTVTRVGHSVLFRSVRYGRFRSKKELSVLFHSFLEFLAAYETQKNAKNVPFFLKEGKRTQRTFRSF